jgi:hypothetical protein
MAPEPINRQCAKRKQNTLPQVTLTGAYTTGTPPATIAGATAIRLGNGVLREYFDTDIAASRSTNNPQIYGNNTHYLVMRGGPVESDYGKFCIEPPN